MKLNKISTLIALAIIGFGFAGCASIIDGGVKPVSISSQPSGAKVTVYDGERAEIAVGQTPALVTLKRSSGYFIPARYRIVIDKQGYKSAQVEIKSVMNGWYLGNVIFGGVLGLLIIDPATGAMWTFTPDDREIQMVLEAENIPSSRAGK